MPGTRSRHFPRIESMSDDIQINTLEHQILSIPTKKPKAKLSDTVTVSVDLEIAMVKDYCEAIFR